MPGDYARINNPRGKEFNNTIEHTLCELKP